MEDITPDNMREYLVGQRKAIMLETTKRPSRDFMSNKICPIATL
jgi:hypothetical protein